MMKQRYKIIRFAPTYWRLFLLCSCSLLSSYFIRAPCHPVAAVRQRREQVCRFFNLAGGKLNRAVSKRRAAAAFKALLQVYPVFVEVAQGASGLPVRRAVEDDAQAQDVNIIHFFCDFKVKNARPAFPRACGRAINMQLTFV